MLTRKNRGTMRACGFSNPSGCKEQKTRSRHTGFALGQRRDERRGCVYGGEIQK